MWSQLMCREPDYEHTALSLCEMKADHHRCPGSDSFNRLMVENSGGLSGLCPTCTDVGRDESQCGFTKTCQTLFLSLNCQSSALADKST